MSDVTPALLDGEDLLTQAHSEVHSPFDGSIVGAVPVCGAVELDRGVAVALERHKAGPPPAYERAAILDRAALLLSERLDDFALSICRESAKPIATARVEAERAVDTLRFSAGVARSLTGEMVAMDASSAGVGKLGFVMRVPIGVVAAISPFNFPLNLVCHKIAPAVAAGCPIVLKPASATPLTALKIARLVEEAGLPPGWLNVITCGGSTANHLVEHPDVAMITFTGSPEVGWAIRARAARKRVGLELGNNAPVILEPSADVELAARKLVVGGYSFAGQTCISVQRIYAHRSIHGDFLDAFAARVGELKVGDPLDPGTDVSTLINRAETDRVAGWVDEAVAAGASLVTGGSRSESGILRPTLVDGVTSEMKLCHSEVFGPVVGVAAYDRFDDAVVMANDTRYGLQAAVFTSEISTALDAARRLDFGGVMINESPTWRADQQPYGGLRDSGNTREGPRYAVEEMTERRMVVIEN